MPRSYFWTDTPDGEDILKKTNFAMKVAFMGGVSAALVDHSFFTQTSLRGYGLRACGYIVPAMGSAAVFSLVSQKLCKSYPKLDPRASYVIGAVSASTVVGAALKSINAGCIVGFYAGISAFFLRDMMNSNLPGGLLGRLPTVLNNDDETMAADYRHAPPFGSLPPPAARPAKAGSLLY